MTTTCQICGRAIKAKTGTIAHHGYQRPGYGYQTRSCFGTHYVPFEVGHDALDHYLKEIEGYLLPTAKARLENHVAQPPLTLKTVVGRYGYAKGTEIVRELPDDFDVEAAIRESDYKMNSYRALWRGQYSELKNAVAGWEHELKFMAERRASWKEPKPAKVLELGTSKVRLVLEKRETI